MMLDYYGLYGESAIQGGRTALLYMGATVVAKSLDYTWKFPERSMPYAKEIIQSQRASGEFAEGEDNGV